MRALVSRRHLKTRPVDLGEAAAPEPVRVEIEAGCLQGTNCRRRVGRGHHLDLGRAILKLAPEECQDLGKLLKSFYGLRGAWARTSIPPFIPSRYRPQYNCWRLNWPSNTQGRIAHSRSPNRARRRGLSSSPTVPLVDCRRRTQFVMALFITRSPPPQDCWLRGG